MGCCCTCWLTTITLVVIIANIIKYLVKGKEYKKSTSVKGKIAIVTGANTGIGKETAKELAKRGATVYMACRDMQKCEEARAEIISETENKEVYSRKLDLASLESIRAFVENFKKEQNKLHLLINNAGYLGWTREQTQDGFEKHIGINHMGHFLLTNLLLDLLKASAPSRIVVVSSRAHERSKLNMDDLNSDKSFSKLKVYGQSKLANILFTRELAKRLKGSNVTVNALHPGLIDTNIFRHIPIFNNTLSNVIFKPIFWPFMKTAENGAQTTLYAALDPDLENVSGMYFSNCGFKEVAPVAKDDAAAKWLWTESEKWTGFKA